MFAYNPQHVYITNYVLATKVLIWFSRTCVEIVVSWIPDSISEFLNRSILMIFLEASDCTDESR